ncbi:MAG TPA: hypothetical protein PLV42_07670 [bacterium]|nr:hypothetical protein [bacterium]
MRTNDDILLVTFSVIYLLIFGCTKEKETFLFTTQITTDTCKYCEGADVEASKKASHAPRLMSLDLDRKTGVVRIYGENLQTQNSKVEKINDNEYEFTEEIPENNTMECVLGKTKRVNVLKIGDHTASWKSTVELKIGKKGYDNRCQWGYQDNQECTIIQEGTAKRE